MKKLMIVCAAAAMLTGCETMRPSVAPEKEPPARQRFLSPMPEDEVEVKKTDKPTLYELTSAHEERRPEKGEVYENDSRRIKIFQSCVEVDEKTKEETPYVLAVGDDLVIAVISKREYVDDEYLVPGKYCYCGPFQYMTAPVVQGVQKSGTKTVRMFIEVSDEEAREIEANKKAEEDKKK